MQTEEYQTGMDYDESRIVQIAKQFGLVKSGYTLEDYLIEAAREGKYATVGLWGEQGSGKSSRLLAQGHWIYKDWDHVLDSIVFKPMELKSKLKSIPMGQRYPWLGWDDVSVHFTSNAFRSDLDAYEAIDKVWASLRVKASVVSLTIPHIGRLAKNLKDYISHEVYIGPNQMLQVQRIVKLQSFNKMAPELFKILIEKPHKFNLFDVPKDVFKEYWQRRLELTEEALDMMDDATGPVDTEGFTRIWDVAKDLCVNANTLQQMGSRGVIETVKIGKVLYVSDDVAMDLRTEYTKSR
jgi:hypothetical protein